ncbi:MAG TPA: hypothetical protein VF824_13105 [Thermoanaerobaculia bacterium]|jgi:hypothetical protein
MSRAARSLFVFGIYVLAVGVAFVLAPAAVIALLHLPPVADGWARVVGLLALVIGGYDVVGSRAECLPYIRASVYLRLGFAIGVIALVATRQMPPAALPLGAIDLAGAAWTALALRAR